MTYSNTNGPGIDNKLIMQPVSGGTYYYLGDGLNSTTELVDSGGNVVSTYTYSSFGYIVDQTGTVENPFLYTGRELDDNGFYYYRERYYDSLSGRFLSEDPIGFLGGDINLYVYVSNSPHNYADPLGLQEAFPFPEDNIPFPVLPERLIPNGAFCTLGPIIIRRNSSNNFGVELFFFTGVGFGGGATYCRKLNCDSCQEQLNPNSPQAPIFALDVKAFVGASIDLDNDLICFDVGPYFTIPLIDFGILGGSFDFPLN